MYNPLFIYPNFTFTNPNSKQFDRLLESIESQCRLTVLARKGPRISNVTSVEVLDVSDTRFRTLFQHGMLKFAGDWAYLPDELRPLVNTRFYRAGRKWMKERHFDSLVSLSFPLSDTLIARKLKRDFGLPWIAIFYDPWTDNQFRRKMRSHFAVDCDRRWEKRVALEADAIIHTNDVIAQRWSDRYGELVNGKIHVLPFCYTKGMMERAQSLQRPSLHEKIVISYIGRCVGKRNLRDILSAIGELKSDNSPGINHLELRAIGLAADSDIAMANSLGLDDIVRFMGPFPEEDLIRFYEESHCFLVVDAPDDENIFFPSKLMDYYFWQRPILGITPERGVTHDLLTLSGGTAIANGNIRAIKEWLHNVLEKGVHSLTFNAEFYKRFDPEITANQFVEILKKSL